MAVKCVVDGVVTKMNDCGCKTWLGGKNKLLLYVIQGLFTTLMFKATMIQVKM